nr:hypothetical protein BaRGS_030852 [Batillaria attramentaria]
MWDGDGITEDHRNWLRVIACKTDLNVPVALGFLVEFSATLYDTWLGQQTLFRSHVLDLVVKVMNGCLLVCGVLRLPTPASAVSQTKGSKEANGVPAKKAGGPDTRNNNDVLYVYHRKRIRAQRKEQ